MRLHLKIISFILGPIFLAGMLSIPTRANCSKELAFGFMVIEPSYRYGKSVTPRGRDLEIFDQVMLRAGCSYTLTKMPWKRVISAVKSGRIDVTIGASYNKERGEFALFSLPYRTETMVMFMRQADIAKLSPASFNDVISSELNIGVHLGSWYGKQYDDAYSSNPEFRGRVLQSSDFRFLHNWLMIGRVDIVLDELFSGLTHVHTAGLANQIWVHPMHVHKNPVHFMFSKKSVSTEDLSHINTALQTFKNTAQYQFLIERFSANQMMKE